MSRLTAKQEKYVQGLVSGLSQRQAYIEAYPNSKKWKPKNVDSKASGLLKQDKVLARYNELIEEHKQKALWTREKASEHLIWLVKQSIISIKEHDGGYVRQGTSSALLGAIRELNELELLYPVQQAQVAKMTESNENQEENVGTMMRRLADELADT